MVETRQSPGEREVSDPGLNDGVEIDLTWRSRHVWHSSLSRHRHILKNTYALEMYDINLDHGPLDGLRRGITA